MIIPRTRRDNFGPNDVFYWFCCNICEKELYHIASYSGFHLEDNNDTSVNLCVECFKTRSNKELTNIARLASEIVIKELAKVKRIEIKNNDKNLEDLISYLSDVRYLYTTNYL